MCCTATTTKPLIRNCHLLLAASGSLLSQTYLRKQADLLAEVIKTFENLLQGIRYGLTWLTTDTDCWKTRNTGMVIFSLIGKKQSSPGYLFLRLPIYRQLPVWYLDVPTDNPAVWKGHMAPTGVPNITSSQLLAINLHTEIKRKKKIHNIL